MIHWTKGDVVCSMRGYPSDHTERGLVSPHMGIVKRRRCWSLIHQPSGLALTSARLQRDAKWLAEQIVDALAEGGELEEVAQRIAPTMIKWTRNGDAPWTEPDDQEEHSVELVEEASEVAKINEVVDKWVKPTPPVTREALARWLDMSARFEGAGLITSWSLSRGRTRIVVALVADDEYASVCDALEAVAWAYRCEVEDVVRMVEEVTP